MVTKIFINLPVKDLKKSVDFFKSLVFGFNTQFTDEKAACMMMSEHIFAMLLTEPFFKTFTKKSIADAHKTTEVMLAVDAMVASAVAAGGAVYIEPQDHGWMYQHSFADLDGHQWQILYMDESKLSVQ